MKKLRIVLTEYQDDRMVYVPVARHSVIVTVDNESEFTPLWYAVEDACAKWCDEKRAALLDEICTSDSDSTGG